MSKAKDKEIEELKADNALLKNALTIAHDSVSYYKRMAGEMQKLLLQSGAKPGKNKKSVPVKSTPPKSKKKRKK